MQSVIRHAICAVVVGTVSLLATQAQAVSIIKNPDPPKYKVEIEPHLNFSGYFLTGYDTFMLGPGARFTIPVMAPGFVKTINDSIGISFGIDFMYWNGYRRCRNGYCYDNGFWAAYFPVAMQWNFWLTDKWSVFGEAGGMLRWYFKHDGDCVGPSCGSNAFGVHPMFNAGGRFHFGETAALTMRIGYPFLASVGVSFFL